MTRLIFLWHRYLGIALSLLFAFWFISGIAMMYARFPILTPEERFPLLAPLDPRAFVVTPGEAVRLAGVEGAPRRIRLLQLVDRPVYSVLPPGAPWVSVYADTGEVFETVDRSLAATVVAQQAPPGATPTFLGRVDTIDQWTLTNSLNLHRPLLRFALDDDAGTEMYVSERTAEIVMVSTRAERVLAWLGPIPHWVAPEILRTRVAGWRQTVLWLSVGGTALAFTGLWIGVQRYRRRGYVLKGGGRTVRTSSPYGGIKLQHHWSGLVFGVVTFTWIASGLLYLNPGGSHQGDLSTTTQMTPYSVGGVRGSQSARPDQAEAMRGGALDPALWTETPGAAWERVLASQATPDAPREIELYRFAGRPWFVFSSGAFDSYTVAADESHGPPLRHHPTELLVQQARKAVQGRLVSARLLDRYDAYYYSVGNVAAKRLPVLRLDFDDPVTSLMYVNTHTGTIFRSYDTQAKVMRWLVVGLHCLDFPFLISNRPAWDGAIIALSGGGLLLSVTGVVMGWRRVRPRRQGGLV
jgi:hypothetical protein